MKIIAISGKMGAGKSTLMKQLDYQYRMRFSDPVYRMHDMVRECASSYGIEMPTKHRKLLEVLGTEVFRADDPDVWVNVMRERLQNLSGVSCTVVIDDLRFFNELTLFREFPDAYLVRLECPTHIRKARCSAWGPQNHPSNTGLDKYIEHFDLIIDTSSPVPADIINEINNW